MKFCEYLVEHEAIETYGCQSQMIVAIEELSELQKELTKHLRGENNVDHISEEMADVYIMLEQLSIMFKNSNAVDVWKRQKLKRLDSRLHNNSSTDN